MTGSIRVRGQASREELAALLAALSRRAPPPDRYELWRAERLAATRRTGPRRSYRSS